MENAHNEASIANRLRALRPQIVFLPHGSDTNAGHRRVYAMFERAARSQPEGCSAFLIRDPKTVEFRLDLYMPFDGEAARWKRRLLQYHRSQEHRNRLWRGHGFDDRILEVNRKIASDLSCGSEFAEAFQIEVLEPPRYERDFPKGAASGDVATHPICSAVQTRAGGKV